AENDEGLSAILNNALAKREEIPFMAVDFEAVVTLTGIQIFFDTLVPENESVDNFKIKIDEILCNTSYLQIFTLSSGDRKKALQAIQDNNFETASDDMFSFHHKIARENGIAISGWSMI
ncbi:26689_t:CDS:2, partial [Dentiscutata erythropus]